MVPQRGPMATRALWPLVLVVLAAFIASGCGDDDPGLFTYGFGFVTWILFCGAVAAVADRQGQSGAGFFFQVQRSSRLELSS